MKCNPIPLMALAGLIGAVTSGFAADNTQMQKALEFLQNARESVKAVPASDFHPSSPVPRTDSVEPAHEYFGTRAPQPGSAASPAPAVTTGSNQASSAEPPPPSGAGRPDIIGMLKSAREAAQKAPAIYHGKRAVAMKELDNAMKAFEAGNKPELLDRLNAAITATEQAIQSVK